MIELTGSGTSVHEIGSGNSVTRTFLIPWTGRGVIAETLLGTPHPSIPWCWCKSVRLEPFGNDPKAGGGDIDPVTEEIVYEYAKCTAEYATDFGTAQLWPADIPKPTIREGTTLTLECQDTSEFMRFPARAARWSDNPDGSPGAAVPEADSPAGRMLVAKTEFVLTWNYLKDVPLVRLRGLIGKTNSTSLLGCSEETLLFLGFDLRPSTRASIVSPGCWMVNAKFSYRAVKVGGSEYGWNHEYRADGWRRVQMSDGSSIVDRYPKADFSGMFA